MRHVSFGFCSKKLFPRYFFMPPPTSRAWPAPLHLVPDYFGINPPFVFCAQDLCCAEKLYFLTLTPYYRRAVRCHWMKKQTCPCVLNCRNVVKTEAQIYLYTLINNMHVRKGNLGTKKLNFARSIDAFMNCVYVPRMT